MRSRRQEFLREPKHSGEEEILERGKEKEKEEKQRVFERLPRLVPAPKEYEELPQEETLRQDSSRLSLSFRGVSHGPCFLKLRQCMASSDWLFL